MHFVVFVDNVTHKELGILFSVFLALLCTLNTM